MRNFYLILGILLMFVTLFLTLINLNTVCKVDILFAIWESYVGQIIISSAFLGGLTASGIWGYFYQHTKTSQSKQTREVERAKIREEEKDDKVKALESKIETLEQALKKALNTK